MIPLVTYIAFGLLATTLLILLVVPAFFAILDNFGLTSLAAERRAALEAGQKKGEGMVDLTGEESNLLFQVLEEWERHLAQLDLDGLERDHDETTQ